VHVDPALGIHFVDDLKESHTDEALFIEFQKGVPCCFIIDAILTAFCD
jgi:hypothetical protein